MNWHVFAVTVRQTMFWLFAIVGMAAFVWPVAINNRRREVLWTLAVLCTLALIVGLVAGMGVRVTTE